MENQNEIRSERERLNDQMRIRQHKLEQIRALGMEPFGERFEQSHHAVFIQQNAPRLEAEGTAVRMAGRLVGLRDHGNTAYARFQDQTGNVQIYFRQNELTEREWKIFKLLDRGDIVGLLGTVFTEHTGEVMVRARSFEILSKALRPLPETWKGPCGKRYVDFIMNPERKEDFQKRALMLRTIRKWLADRDFLEVETPLLQPLHVSADAEAFETHLHALDIPLYLRAAPELYLKRLIVGGFGRVFEMNRNFRNKAMDDWHSPEFTALGIYEAHGDMGDAISHLKEICAACAEAVHGQPRFLCQGVLLDLSPSGWAQMTMAEAVKKYTGADFDKAGNLGEARKLADHLKAAYDTYDTFGQILARCFAAYVKDQLVQPTIITRHPVEVSPLARKCGDAPAFTDRFEAYIHGKEIACGFSELNDPAEQRMRFEMQLEGQAHGEACQMDEDFIRALEYGLPPTAGLGIGIDRLAMILLGKDSIRDVLLFPLVEMEE